MLANSTRKPLSNMPAWSAAASATRPFNPLEEEVSCKKVAPEGMLIDIAHLIDTKSVEKYQNRYSTATKQLKNCEVTVSGPWPPYHFLPGKLRTVAGNS